MESSNQLKTLLEAIKMDVGDFRLVRLRRPSVIRCGTCEKCVCVCVSQEEVDSLRSENDGLKAAESEVVMTMRRNAQLASEYLNKTASHAHSSIRSVCANRCVCGFHRSSWKVKPKHVLGPIVLDSSMFCRCPDIYGNSWKMMELNSCCCNTSVCLSVCLPTCPPPVSCWRKQRLFAWSLSSFIPLTGSPT